MEVASVDLSRVQVRDQTFVSKVYAWMCSGLIATGLVAWLAATSGTAERLFREHPGLLLGLIVGELLLVIVLSAAIHKLSPSAAALLYFVYSALTGLTLSLIFLVYTQGSIAATFFVTAGTFGAMSVYGYTTKRDLTSIGNLCFMGLIGVIIASVVNLFLRSPGLYWAVTYVGVLVFVALTAYDTQKIKAYGQRAVLGSEEATKMALLGALALYLDFIGLFLFLLRIFGRRR